MFCVDWGLDLGSREGSLETYMKNYRYSDLLVTSIDIDELVQSWWF